MPEKRIFAKAGHICMVCGFRATTKNKYRELQDHLVRRHFQDRIKASLPTRRPFMCPDLSCTVEGKDWQALMRHYTGKHGVLEAYLKEFLVANEHKENIHLGEKRHVSKICPSLSHDPRPHPRSRRKRPSSSGSTSAADAAMAAEDKTEDTPRSRLSTASTIAASISTANGVADTVTMIPPANAPTLSGSCALTPPSDPEEGETIIDLDEKHPAEIPPTHLALVLKRRKIGPNGNEQEETEDTYAFVDLKYFMPISANKYIIRGNPGSVPGIPGNVPGPIPGYLPPVNPNPAMLPPGQTHLQDYTTSMASVADQGYFVSSSTTAGGAAIPRLTSGGVTTYPTAPPTGTTTLVQSPYFESFPAPTTNVVSTGSESSSTVTHSPESPTIYTTTAATVDGEPSAVQPHHTLVEPSASYHIVHDYATSADQVVPTTTFIAPDTPMGTAVMLEDGSYVTSEIEVSPDGQLACERPIVMEVPLSDGSGGGIATVTLDPKNLVTSTGGLGGCSKVVVESVKSIPVEASTDLTSTAFQAANAGPSSNASTPVTEAVAPTAVHLNTDMKELDFAMF